MGREARCDVTLVEGGARTSGSGKVLLEGTEVIVRGDVKRRLARADLRSASVEGVTLVLDFGAATLRLVLPEGEAPKWQRALSTPPPTLADKLGLRAGSRVVVSGPVDGIAELREALTGASRVDVGPADAVVAVVEDAADLEAVIALHRGLGDSAAGVWLVHRKGKAATVPEAVVRRTLHDAGLVDTKVAAVSEVYTAAQYRRRRSG